MIRGFLHLIAVVIIALSAVGCRQGDRLGDAEAPNEMRHSSLLSMYKSEGCTRVDIKNPWDSTSLLASYILVVDGAEAPQHEVEVQEIRVPVKSLVVYTSVHAGALKELGKIGVVTGVADAQFYKIPEIVEGLKSSVVVDVGKIDAPVAERIIDLNPDAIMLSLYQGMNLNSVKNLNIPLLQMVDNMETTPLGRAEWIKFLGELTGKRAEADSVFEAVEKEYTTIKEKAQASRSKNPKVLVENMYQGVWYVSGGASYQATMIQDAGGDYAWADDKSTGSLFLSFEQVFDKAHDADVWLLKVFGQELSKDALQAMDSRNMLFGAVINGGVYFSNTAESNLFEEFPFHPELMLKDYIEIFHPEVYDDFTPRYFKQMTK